MGNWSGILWNLENPEGIVRSKFLEAHEDGGDMEAIVVVRFGHKRKKSVRKCEERWYYECKGWLLVNDTVQFGCNDWPGVGLTCVHLLWYQRNIFSLEVRLQLHFGFLCKYLMCVDFVWNYAPTIWLVSSRLVLISDCVYLGIFLLFSFFVKK